MPVDQLNLFNQQNESMVEGYEKLADFRFTEAERVFRKVKETFKAPDPEIEEALSCINYWKNIFAQPECVQSSDSIQFLYKEINRYDFPKKWGFEKFRSALLNRLIKIMQQADHFYINEDAALSDIYLELGNHGKAERVLMERLSAFPGDSQARFRLAQIQWNHKLMGEAKRNYSLALLYDPQTVPGKYLECEQTEALIEKYRPEMASAYGWVRGIFPLLQVPDDISPVSEAHQKAIECYQLLRKAERTSKNNQMEACVEYRKLLKSCDAEFYEAYYSLISNRKQPYFY